MEIEAVYNKSFENALNTANTKKIYIHYFDIEPTQKSNWYNDVIFPKYVLRDVADEYKSYEIIPVVYIVNRTFKEEDLDIMMLIFRMAVGDL